MRAVILLIILSSIMTVNAQSSREQREERIRTFKIGFLTERLNLSEKEAQDFWPIYNEFDKKMETLRKKEFTVLRSSDKKTGNLTDAQAEKVLTTVLEVEQERALYKIKFAEQLKKILPVTKVLAFFKAEEDFKRRLIRELRNKRGRPQKN